MAALIPSLLSTTLSNCFLPYFRYNYVGHPERLYQRYPSFTGAFQSFYVDLCSQLRPAHDSKAAAAQTIPRVSFQKLVSAKRYPHATQSSDIVDGVYHLRQFSIRPDAPHSLFYDDKAVIAHDALIHVLSAIWEHAPVSQREFKDIVTSTCAYVPAHVVSRFLLLIHRPTSHLAEKVVIGPFGHSVVGESYLRTLTPKSTTAVPNLISTTLPWLPGDNSQHHQLPSPSLPRENVSIQAQDQDTRKRKHLFNFQQMKKRKAFDGSVSVVDSDEESAALKEHDVQAESSGAGAARGTAGQRPVVKPRRSRKARCLLWPF
ncbi:hypothetical protein BDZ89DRAFT_666611 [Hymenopellis radicata]|nr:hypothetical protein BDZ89DRAFT_666611 [Hymenopellis radicata]